MQARELFLKILRKRQCSTRAQLSVESSVAFQDFQIRSAWCMGPDAILGLMNAHHDLLRLHVHAGVKGEFYNLVSDPDHILNARLVKHGKRLGSDGVKWIDPPHLAQDANWMDTLGLTYKDDTVEIQNSADGKAKGDPWTVISICGTRAAVHLPLPPPPPPPPPGAVGQKMLEKHVHQLHLQANSTCGCLFVG